MLSDTDYSFASFYRSTMEVTLAVLVSLIGDGESCMKKAASPVLPKDPNPTAYPCENNARATFYDMLAA
jgi:hypothetical protein